MAAASQSVLDWIGEVRERPLTRFQCSDMTDSKNMDLPTADHDMIRSVCVVSPRSLTMIIGCILHLATSTALFPHSTHRVMFPLKDKFFMVITLETKLLCLLALKKDVRGAICTQNLINSWLKLLLWNFAWGTCDVTIVWNILCLVGIGWVLVGHESMWGGINRLPYIEQFVLKGLLCMMIDGFTLYSQSD